MRPNRLLVFCLSLVAVLAATSPHYTEAQSAMGPTIAPGDPLPAEMLRADGGPAGAALAPLVGKRPILVVYWRPNYAVSEQALVKAYTVATAVAPEVSFVPLAALAKGQSPAEIPDRLGALGMKHFMPHEDTGQLALTIGVRAVPSFLLIDAGGVVRAVGGSDIAQVGKQGLSIVEALGLAAKGSPIPTLGVLPNNPIYLMTGQKLPELNVAEAKPDPSAPGRDNLVYHKLADYYGHGKSMLLFYWRPGCVHCEKVLPELRAWWTAKHPEDVAVVDVCRGDYPIMRDASKKYIADYPFTHVFDMDQSVSRALKVIETPSVFLVAPDGEVIGVRSGESIDWDSFLATKPASRAGAVR